MSFSFRQSCVQLPRHRRVRFSRHQVANQQPSLEQIHAVVTEIKQIGLPLRGRPILLITRMITDRIGLHSVLLPLLINARHQICLSSFSRVHLDSFSVLFFVFLYSASPLKVTIAI